MTDAYTGSAISGASVTWGSYNTITDGSGGYIFYPVPCEMNTLTVKKSGYQTSSQSYTPPCNQNSEKNIVLSPTPPPSTRIIRLEGDLTFGEVQVGSSAQRTMTIYNDGNSTLTVNSISYPAGFSGNWNGIVASGSSQPVTVTFSPTEQKTYTGNVTVTSDATSGINAKYVSGTGVTSSHAVTAKIDSISPSQATQGTAVYFSGTGSDSSGHSIMAYSWRSSIDGIIGTSASFVKNDLSAGSHNIYFKVQCSNGKWSSEVPWTGNPLVITPIPTPTLLNTFVIQPGPKGKDTFYGTAFLTGGNPDAELLYIGGWGDWYYDFIEFDLTGSPSADDTVSATLYLHGNAPNDPVLQIHRNIESWTESGVTLLNNPAGVFYKNFGPFTTGAASAWNKVDITDLYKGWKTGAYSNYGIKLVPTKNNHTNGVIDSSDSLDSTKRPKIEIVYSFTGATQTPIPTPTPAPTPTPLPCKVKKLDVEPKSLRLVRETSTQKTVTLTCKGGLPSENLPVKVKIVDGKKFVNVSPAVAYTDRNGQATFTITAMNKTGGAIVRFNHKNLKDDVIVKVRKK